MAKEKEPITSLKDLCKLISECDFATVRLEVQNGTIVFVSVEDKHKSKVDCVELLKLFGGLS